MYQKKSVKLNRTQYNRFQKAVFGRDNYTCQAPDCDCDSSYLTIHHIIPRGRLRLDTMKNAMTTSLDCHIRIHDTPGMVDQIIKDKGIEGWNKINK